MGKGDQKTRRGKLFKGSYGVKRKRKKTATHAAPDKPKSNAHGSNPKADASKQVKKPAATRKTTKPESKAEDSSTV